MEKINTEKEQNQHRKSNNISTEKEQNHHRKSNNISTKKEQNHHRKSNTEKATISAQCQTSTLVSGPCYKNISKTISTVEYPCQDPVIRISAKPSVQWNTPVRILLQEYQQNHQYSGIPLSAPCYKNISETIRTVV